MTQAPVHVAPVDAAPADGAPDAPADVGEHYIHQPGNEPARRALRLVSDQPFTLVTAQQSTLLRTRKGAYDVETNQPALDTTVLIHDRDEFFALYDVAAKKRLGRVQGPIVAASAALHAYVIDDQKLGRGLQFAATARFVRPTVTLPGGSVATDVQLALAGDSDVLWAIARGADGKAFHGRWSNPQVAALTVFEPLPAWPGYMRGEVDAIVTDADPACRGGTLLYPSPRHCVPDDARSYAGHGRWRTDDNELVDASGAHVPLMPGCPRTSVAVVATEADSGAVLSTCPLDGDEQPYELSLPTGTWRWWEPATTKREATGEEPALVAPLASAPTGVTTWLDLERALVFASPALSPLTQPWVWTPDGGIRHRVARQLIASTPGVNSDLWALDLDRGTYDHIGRIDGCPYTLAVTDLDPTGTRILIDCNPTDTEGNRANPPVGAPAGWIEILDLPGRTRQRAADVLGGKLVPGGAVGSYTTLAGPGDAAKRPGARPQKRKLPVPYESRLVLVTPGQ